MEEARSTTTIAGRRVYVARSDIWFLLRAAVVIAVDQLTKWGIRSWLDRGEAWPEGSFARIVHVTNSGAAFGILQDTGPLLIITGLAGTAAILILLLSPTFSHPFMRAGLALMLGGALGNLIDRFNTGEVVDFLKVSGWPAFNVADSAITIGVVILLWAILFEPRRTATSDENST